MRDIEYTKVGNYYLPNIKAPTEKSYQLGKYARMKLVYLKEHKKVQYQQLLLEERLNEYLHSIDEEANDLYEILLKQYKEKWGVTEELKERDQLRWIQEMNNIDKCIDEVISNTTIY